MTVWMVCPKILTYFRNAYTNVPDIEVFGQQCKGRFRWNGSGVFIITTLENTCMIQTKSWFIVAIVLISRAVDRSMNSKSRSSLMPKDFSWSTTPFRFVRWISGVVDSSISFMYANFVYRRKHFPGPTRPARPLRWFAEALEQGTTTKFDMPVAGL